MTGREIGIYQTYCQHPHPITMQFFPYRHTFGGASFSMTPKEERKKHDEGAPFRFECESLSKVKLLDASKNVLYKIYEDDSSWTKDHFKAKDAHGNKILYVRQDSSFSQKKYTVSFTNRASGQLNECKLDLVANKRSRMYELRSNAVIFATFTRRDNTWGEPKAFSLTVYAHVDASMVLAVCVTMYILRIRKGEDEEWDLIENILGSS